MHEVECPNSIKIAIQLLVVNTLFGVFLFYGQRETMLEPVGSWSWLAISLVLCTFWFSITWFIYKKSLWARNTAMFLLIISIGYTALGVMNNPAIVAPVEFLQTASDLVVLFLLGGPESIKWVKNDS